MYLDKIHAVIDLETLNTCPGGIILSCGIKSFKLGTSQDSLPTYYQTIAEASSKQAGFTESESTRKWWDEQNEFAKMAAFAGQMTVTQFLLDLQKYFTQLGNQKDIVVWGNGANFDIVLLEAYYNKFNTKFPWHYHNVGCYRTLRNMFKNKVPSTKMEEGTAHHALEDAAHEAAHLRKILEHFYGKR